MEVKKCLCDNCSKCCNNCLKTELAMRGKLTYTSSDDSDRQVVTCSLYSPRIIFTNISVFGRHTKELFAVKANC